MRLLVFVLALGLLLDGAHARAKRSDTEIEELREKLDSLHDVLEELNNNIAEYNEQHEEEEDHSDLDKRGLLPKETQDAFDDDSEMELIDFEEQLSEEDMELLKKYPSVVAHLKLALVAGSIPEDQEEPMKRDQDEMDAFVGQLSPQDQQLLQNNPSMLVKLSQAVDKPTHTEADEMAEEVMRRDNDDAAEFIANLSPEDQELIRKHPSMLDDLMAAIEKPTHTEEQEILADSEQGTVEEFVVEPDEEPVELQVMKDKLAQLRTSLENYHRSETGGTRCLNGRDCSEEKDVAERGCSCEGKRECRCEPDKGTLPERECRCESESEEKERECRCDDKDQALTEVEARFLEDVKYAKRRGVSLRKLIEAMAAKKTAKRDFLTDNERALEGLAHK